MDFIKDLFQKIPFKEVLLPTVVLLSGLLTFAPTEWIQYLGLDQLLSNHKGYVGVTFLFTAILSITFLVTDKYKEIKRKRDEIERKREEKKRISSILESLDAEEKAILREFYLQELNTIWTWAPDNILASLLHKGVVERIDAYQDALGRQSNTYICLTPEVKDLISAAIVDLPQGELTPEQRKEIEESRPSFIRNERGKFPRHFG